MEFGADFIRLIYDLLIVIRNHCRSMSGARVVTCKCNDQEVAAVLLDIGLNKGFEVCNSVLCRPTANRGVNVIYSTSVAANVRLGSFLYRPVEVGHVNVIYGIAENVGDKLLY